MEDGKLTVRAVERAMDILLCFVDVKELSLTEISNKVSLHKSTVHRLLASLEGKAFIQRDGATEKYRLGFRLWELSANLIQSDDMGVVLLPEMERLRDQVGETISLYIRDGNERVRVQAVQSNQAIRRVAPVGARMPLFVGASSKVLLAYADEAVQEQVINTAKITSGLDSNVLIQMLEDTRKLGFATSIEEREPGAAAVSAPIFGRDGKLMASLAVSGPANRLTQTKMLEHVPSIIEAAHRMGTMLR
ncbi:IclR family transcriptional regulator [Paenibacillus psychroresistens]|uniref:Glycerol operon regulatory protein n=1 Tax=Paenibacillus psychroresistens TaxID=1778678 RepID=A0A6B8RRJ5_9BACL|nr:IclR family transcriptional regulator [Paenibacillus psychroresistens]QGQ98589.1 IclR family transcriptional regulator [Paenibacillus psychroresistens]